jgi:hypothetical protein
MASMLFGYRTLPQNEAADFAETISGRMAKDEQFQPMLPVVNELKVALQAFKDARSEAEKGGEDRTLEKNNKLEIMREKLDTVGMQVYAFAAKRESIILAAGFNVRKKGTHVSSLTTPIGLSGRDVEQEGCAEIWWQAVDNAVNYSIEVRTGDGEWKNGRSSTRPNSTIIEGLEKGKYWEIRVRAMGRNYLESNYSQPITILVS